MFKDKADIRTMETSARLKFLLDSAPVAVYSCDPHNGFAVTYVSAFVSQLMGYQPTEIVDRPGFLFENLHPEDFAATMQNLNLLLSGESKLRKYRFRMKNGNWRWLRDRSKLIVDDNGKLVEIIGAWTDIQELIQIEEALRISEQQHRFLLEHINVGVLSLTPAGVIAYINPQSSQLLGYPEQQLLTMSEDSLEGLLYNENGARLSKQNFPLAQVLNTGTAVENQVIGVRHSGQEMTRWLLVNAFPQRDERHQIVSVIVTLLDISERIKAQEKIHQLAYYDPLTNLPNRFSINLLLEQAVQHARRDSKQFALLFLDLDDFKFVNDSLGHHAGDDLLRQMARRLQKNLRECDTVGRLGGDEFVVLLDSIDQDGAGLVAEKIASAFKQPFFINGHPLTTRCSIGISIYPNDGLDPDALTRCADIAMYHAKSSRRGEYQFFETQMNLKLEKRIAIERDLYQAIRDHQFVLHYQPQVDPVSARIVGLEALIRWRHPERGMISPLDFIPIAEQTQQIHLIGLWVLRQACQDIKTWQQQGIDDITVAVNLSFRQMQNSGLITQMLEIIDNAGIKPDNLELELTESVMMENQGVALGFMKQCRTLGIQFSIDDFGTGYSSLSYLTKLPLTKIKIDRAFVKEIGRGDEADTLVSAIVNMAKSLRLKVVAEGAETEQQIDYLRRCGCEIVQGFYYSPPVAFEKITEQLQANRNAVSRSG